MSIQKKNFLPSLKQKKPQKVIKTGQSEIIQPKVTYS